VTRGIYSSLLSQDGYANSEKDWFIELIQSNIYWYDLLVNEHKLFDTRKLIKDELLQHKKIVEENLEKRFIYFISSRTKVRFDKKKQPKTTLFTKKLKVYLLIGKNQKRISVTVPLLRKDNKPITALVDEKFITIDSSETDKISMSVHDFLVNFNIDLGIYSKVQYVGYTKNPETRPTNGAHTGLSNILHNVPNDEDDIFISFNIFKVTTKAVDTQSNIDFIISNSMTDEVGVDLEGLIIEKCFILYFDSNNQVLNKKNERMQLTNNLIKLKKGNNINSIQILYEMEAPNEYFTLSSDVVPPKIQHLFTVEEMNNEITIQNGSKMYSASYEESV